MRARISWPRSSVPKGWFSEGGSSRAVKSISLIEIGQRNWPKTTARINTSRITVLPTASLCRRNRRQASRAGEICGARPSLAAPGLAESNAGVEPAIKHIRDEVEEDHQTREDEGHGHDDRRVVGEDGGDQQRADA